MALTDDVPPDSWGGRFGAFWRRHRALLWTLHSFWAFATGVAVIVLARERYGFIPWVVVFLTVTWASTMFFGRRTSGESAGGPGLADEVTSYLTRTLYQETLFFLLPFYAYSTVIGTPNTLFLGLLGLLAMLSCIDLVFDRWLRTRPVFGLVFFASVAFAALNLLIPMFFSLDPAVGTPLAAGLAVGSSIPLVLRGPVLGRGGRWRLGAAAALILLVAWRVPALVPPVPLRMESATFASSIDRETLELSGRMGERITSAEAGPRLVVLVEVFAPADVPARVALEWKRGRATLRTSREVEIVAHDGGFRVWDGWMPPAGAVEPGNYRIVLRTAHRRVFGVARLRVDGS